MMTDNVRSDTLFGTVEFEGKTLKLIQDPYVSGGINGPVYYEAAAIDDDENEYEVRWALIPEYETWLEGLKEDGYDEDGVCWEEEDACDWDVYTVINHGMRYVDPE